MSKKINIDKYHKDIVNMFQYENKTDKEIAKTIGICSDSVIRRYRHKHNIIRLYKNEEWLIKQFETGESSVIISRKINCDPSCIQKAFKRIGLTDNNKKEIIQVNNIFNEYTEESCYWAGFINADGHIDMYLPSYRKLPNYKLSFTLSQKDYNHLNKLVKILGYNKITETKTNAWGKEYNTIKFATNKKSICMDLIDKYEITPKEKSCNEKFPNKIPSKYMSDYIRGYFDGDGCVYLNGNKPCVTIVSSANFCKDLKHFLSLELKTDIGHIYKEKECDLYRYSIFKKDHVELFYDYIYKTKKVYLERKYNVFYDYYNKI